MVAANIYVTFHEETKLNALEMIFLLKTTVTKYGSLAIPGPNLKSLAPTVSEICAKVRAGRSY